VLVHELGHAIVAGLCKTPAHIVLYSFGGLAIGNYHLAQRWQRIAIYLAGPGAGFILYGIVLAVEALIRQHDPFLLRWRPDPRVLAWDPTAVTYGGAIVSFLKFINLLWGLLNLLPIFPLDGGQVMREVCTGISPRSGMRVSLGLSFLLAGLIAVYSIIKMSRPNLPYPPFDPTFNVLLFGLLALQSYQMMQQVEREQRRWENDENPW